MNSSRQYSNTLTQGIELTQNKVTKVIGQNLPILPGVKDVESEYFKLDLSPQLLNRLRNCTRP